MTYDIAVGWIISYANAVSQAPAEHGTTRVLDRLGAVLDKICNFKCAKLAAARGDVACGHVNVAVRSARHEQQLWIVSGDQQRAADVTALLHARDDVLSSTHGAFGGIIWVCPNVGRR